MDNITTLFDYSQPGGGVRITRGSVRNMFEGSRADTKSKLALPATSSELVALAPCVNLKPEDILTMIVLDGRTKVSDTLYGGPGSGCPLRPEDKKRMEAALAAMPVGVDARPESSAVRDIHLFEGWFA